MRKRTFKNQLEDIRENMKTTIKSIDDILIEYNKEEKFEPIEISVLRSIHYDCSRTMKMIGYIQKYLQLRKENKIKESDEQIRKIDSLGDHEDE